MSDFTLNHAGGAPDNTRIGFFSIADKTGFLYFIPPKPKIGSGSNVAIPYVAFVTAMPLNLTPLLRSIIFICQSALGGSASV